MNIFLAVPCYGGIYPEVAAAIQTASTQHNVAVQYLDGSNLPFTFQTLWNRALNSRATGRWDYFAMLHADISAPPGWLDRLVEEITAHDADVVSQVVPIKDDSGLTSTGVLNEAGVVEQYSIDQVKWMPETWSVPADKGRLAINTGMWICDFRKPWVENITFHLHTDNRRLEDGTFQAVTLSEDWDASAAMHEMGLKVMATKRVAIKHFGKKAWTL
jgi:hypothetical protein